MMKGKIALVTGSSRGIGRAVALRLAAQGVTVAVHCGFRREAAEEVAAEITKSGGESFILQADVGRIEEIDALYDDLDVELMRLTGEAKFDILVNAAGIAPRGTIETTIEEDFDRAFAVNVKGTFFMIQKGLPRLRDGGRIVNFSSCVARLASPRTAAYAPTKGAVNVLTLLLAAQLGKRGITVNAVAPGPTDTDMPASWLRTPEGRRMVIETSALGRVGEPEDIAGVVAFLASPDSGWVTGQIIEASGGYKI